VHPIRSRPGTTHKPGYWSDKENRKKFLLEFAEKMGFDPMIAENWQGQFYNILAAGVTSSHFKALIKKKKKKQNSRKCKLKSSI